MPDNVSLTPSELQHTLYMYSTSVTAFDKWDLILSDLFSTFSRAHPNRSQTLPMHPHTLLPAMVSKAIVCFL